MILGAAAEIKLCRSFFCCIQKKYACEIKSAGKIELLLKSVIRPNECGNEIVFAVVYEEILT